MSKKPLQSRHRIPDAALELRADPITDRYQAEVDASVARLERAYRKAQAALEAAERRADKAKSRAEALATKQAEAAAIAEHRAAEESRLSEYIARIKEAAQASRVAAARDEQVRRKQEATDKRNAITALRKQEAKANREREQQLAHTRRELVGLQNIVEERRRELRVIEQLMRPGNYAGGNHRGNGTVRHTHGERI